MIHGQNQVRKDPHFLKIDPVEDPHDWYDQYGVTCGLACTYIFRIYKTFWFWTPLSCHNTGPKKTKLWHRFDVLSALRNFTHIWQRIVFQKKSHGNNLQNWASILNQRSTNPLGSTLIRYGASILQIVAVTFF